MDLYSVNCQIIQSRLLALPPTQWPPHHGHIPMESHMTNVERTLFSPYSFNDLTLKNRIVMASMTRGRARNEGLVPTGLHVEYYRQRASAGLILTEATWVSPGAIGFINVPGLYTHAQTEGWRKVVDAVHAEGGRIYAQLGHPG